MKKYQQSVQRNLVVLSLFSNFCPEISFKYLSYYADHMHKYVDEIDQYTGNSIAERDNLENDWKHTWMSVSPRFYLDCDVLKALSNTMKNWVTII